MSEKTVLKKILKVIFYIFLFAYAAVTVFPLFWSILTSIKSYEDASLGVFWPTEPLSVDAYQTIFKSKYLLWVWNSTYIAIIITFINLVFNTLAGYAFARMKFIGKKSVYKMFLLLIMVPAQATMIPMYVIVSRLGLINTHAGLIIVAMVNITYIFMMRQFFINFPKELEESGKMDGLSSIGIFFRVVLPSAKPAIASQMIFIFMGSWNELMRPVLYISKPDLYLLPQGLVTLKKLNEVSVDWRISMAGAVLSLLPIFILFIAMNRYFVTINDQSAGIK